MKEFLEILGIFVAAMVSLYASVLTYALRDFSASRLEDALKKRKLENLLDIFSDNRTDLVYLTAIFRMLGTILTVVCWTSLSGNLVGILVSMVILIIFSIAMPTAISIYAGETIIALSATILLAILKTLRPLNALMHFCDWAVTKVIGSAAHPQQEQIEKEIISVIQEGEKEGVVDTQERRMIESVIEFRDREVGQTMTSRPEIKAIEIGADLESIRTLFEETGHSRLPVYNGTLDHIEGILHARDLLKKVGHSTENFDIRKLMRPAIFVPETKALKELLVEFRIQKVHIAIVLDEYGGTSGLVTIEDILEELVGEISDEHEPHERASWRKLGPGSWEVDARLYIDEINRSLKLGIPEDTGVDTIGGWVSTMLGRIPQKGAVYEQNGIRFEVIEAEPQVVKRIKIDAPGKGEELQS